MNPFIEKISQIFEKDDYSPLEKVIYAYDYVTDDDLILEKEKTLEDILINSKVRCYVKNNNIVIYINDDKYTISGIYIIDSFNKDFYSRYSFLCPKKGNEQNDIIISNDKLIEFDVADEKDIDFDTVEKINMLSELIDEKQIIKKETGYHSDREYFFNKQQVLLDLNRYIGLYNRRITAYDLIDALFEVRKNQYIYGDVEYPFSKDDFIKTIIESNWKFYNRNESLLFNLFHININAINEAKEFFDKNNLEEEINNVKMKKKLK